MNKHEFAVDRFKFKQISEEEIFLAKLSKEPLDIGRIKLSQSSVIIRYLLKHGIIEEDKSNFRVLISFTFHKQGQWWELFHKKTSPYRPVLRKEGTVITSGLREVVSVGTGSHGPG